MSKIKNWAHRLASKVVSKVTEFAYNPDQVEIFQLMCELYEMLLG